MRNIILVAAICLTFGKPAEIQAGERTLDSGVVAGWEAVGRLNLAGRNMCTGVLIASDLVLTAAHCLFDPQNGKRFTPGSIRFEAGLNNGSSKAERVVAKAFLHPKFRYNSQGTSQIGYDIAILRLKRPISAQEIVPLTTEARPEQGDALGVVSYTVFHANSPTLQEPCYVLARRADTLVMNCEVDFGASGSPVFSVKGGKTPRLVSVISAKAEMGKQAVSVGTILDGALQALLKRAG